MPGLPELVSLVALRLQELAEFARERKDAALVRCGSVSRPDGTLLFWLLIVAAAPPCPSAPLGVGFPSAARTDKLHKCRQNGNDFEEHKYQDA
jgi:hypothetical protein